MSESRVTCDGGVEGDYKGAPGERQVTVVSKAAWEAALSELRVSLPWTVRRANFLFDQVDLEDSKGARLSIGDVVLEVTGENAPCEVMDEQCPGLRGALSPSWRGGVACRVIQGGAVKVGDAVILSKPS